MTLSRHIRRIPLIAALLVCAASAVAHADPADDFVKLCMDEQKIPGLSLVVLRSGAILKAEGYGITDRAAKTPATRETVYKIASVGKQFVATGIMLLAQEGRLRLDDPINKYLPGAPSSWSALTIRHLLTHTSGLARESPAFTPFENKPDVELLAALHSVALRFRPGEKWEYSNSGYVALAEIIRVVAGQPWTQFLDQRIFTPAGMSNTLPTNTTAAVPNRAVGYSGNDNQRKADEWKALRASGAYLSTVLDLAKWDALLHGDKILNETSRREMWRTVYLNDRTTAPYGFGWHVDSGRRGRRVWHGGGLPGFTAHFVRYLDEQLSVVVLTNGDDTDVAAIANGVATLYLDQR